MIVDFTRNQEGYELTPTLSILEDYSQQMSFEEVVLPSMAHRFKKLEGRAPNYGFSDSAFWVRFTLYNPGKKRETVIIRQDYTLIDYLDLHYQVDGEWREYATGDRRDFGTRAIAHREFLFPVQLEPESTSTYYMRYRSEGSTNIGLWVYSPQQILRESSFKHLLLGMYYGGFLVLIVYNLFIFSAVRESVFLYYLAFAATYGIYFSVHNGLAYQFFWPNSPVWGNQALVVLLAGSLIFSMQFARKILALDLFSTKYDQLAKGCIATSFVCLIASFFLNYNIVIVPLAGLTTVCALLVMTFGTLRLFSGYPPARYFMFGWVIMLISILIFMLKTFGVLPHNGFTQNALQIGSWLEMVLLSLALGSRVNELRRLSQIDDLTTLSNRRELDQKLMEEFRRSRKNSQPLAVMLLDIDYFKAFNDTHGNALGDEALRVTGQILRESVRKPVTAYRFGGDKFALLLPRLYQEHTILIAERVRSLIDNQHQINEKITVSIGVASTEDHEFHATADLLDAADSALFTAKKLGRNQVVFFDDDADQASSRVRASVPDVG